MMEPCCTICGDHGGPMIYWTDRAGEIKWTHGTCLKGIGRNG